MLRGSEIQDSELLRRKEKIQGLLFSSSKVTVRTLDFGVKACSILQFVRERAKNLAADRMIT
jgi:hypothetical protein